MKPPPFRYHDPKTVGETVTLLDRLENAKLLAGGQSLMPMLNFRFVQPDHIIDINRVEGLSYIRESGGALEIGAMTRQRDLEFSDLVRTRWPIMINSIGLPTKGINYFLSHQVPDYKRFAPPLVGSISATTIEDFEAMRCSGR